MEVGVGVGEEGEGEEGGEALHLPWLAIPWVLVSTAVAGYGPQLED